MIWIAVGGVYAVGFVFGARWCYKMVEGQSAEDMLGSMMFGLVWPMALIVQAHELFKRRGVPALEKALRATLFRGL